jgi:hypothetical protein
MRPKLDVLAFTALAVAGHAGSVVAQTLVFNSPYSCPNAVSIVVDRCEMRGRLEICTFQNLKNGQLVDHQSSNRDQLIKRLQSCTPPQASQPGATQNMNPPYLSQFPSVDRVKAELKGTDAMDTAARQMGAFWQLQEIIKELSGFRWSRNQLTPDEKRLLGEYSGGYQAASQPYASPPDKAKWYQMHAFYEVDEGFRNGLFNRFLSLVLLAEYTKTKGDTRATVQANQQAQQQAFKEQQARAQAELQEFLKQQQQPEWRRHLTRCVAAGRSESQCFAEELGKSFQDLSPVAKNKPRPAGLSVSGVYAAQSGFSLTFGPSGAVATCKSVSAQADYRVQRDGNQVQIRLVAPSPADMLGFGSEVLEKLIPKNPGVNPNEWQGQQIALPVRSDGKLAGPSTIQVTGPVPVGTKPGIKTVSETDANGITSTRSVPTTVTVYAPKTEQCPLGVLSPTDKAPLVGSSMSTTFATVFELISGNTDPGASVKQPDPGLRMNGQYVGQAGFDIEFYPESALISCRQAVVARDYTVSINGNRVVVNIQHGGMPIALELRTDGALAGSGSIQVNGRLVTGQKERVENAVVVREPVFQATTDACTLGVLTPTQPK